MKVSLYHSATNCNEPLCDWPCKEYSHVADMEFAGKGVFESLFEGLQNPSHGTIAVIDGRVFRYAETGWYELAAVLVLRRVA